MNGNRFLARRVTPALGLAAGQADRYLDPYGERQRAVWAEFKAEMAAVGFGPLERELLVDAARAMFVAIVEMSAELSAVSARAGGDS